MSLSGVRVGPLTPSDLAREPRHLHVVAWFDGWTQADGGRPTTYPRHLSEDEARSWREGWAQGCAERVCDAVPRGHPPCREGARFPHRHYLDELDPWTEHDPTAEEAPA